MSLQLRNVLIFGLFGLLGLAGAGRGRAATEPETEREKEKAQAAPRLDLSGPIRDLRKREKGLEFFSVEAAWRGEGRLTIARAFGTGVGIWKNESQFRLSRGEIRSIVEKLDTAGFGKMPEQFGEDLDKDQALEMKGRVTVTLGNAMKAVVQLTDGPQSEALERLAKGIVEICGRAADKGGVRASSLPEALQKVVRHELAPETVQIYVQRLVERPAPDEDPVGWMLHSTGRDFLLRERSRTTGYGEQVLYRLSPEEFDGLARLLAECDPAGFPGNLYAPDYTDFDLKILNQKRNLQARPFLNVTPQTHGEKQKNFDRAYAALDALHRKAMKEGTPAPQAN